MKKKAFTKKMKKQTIQQKATVPVLYQNIGGEVYAFAEVGQEVYFAKVPLSARSPQAVKEALFGENFEKDAA
jgi:hypothetical protein